MARCRFFMGKIRKLNFKSLNRASFQVFGLLFLALVGSNSFYFNGNEILPADANSAVAVEDVVQNKELPEKQAMDEISKDFKTTNVAAPVRPASAMRTVAASPTNFSNYIQIGGRTLGITDVASIETTLQNPNAVYRYTVPETGGSYIYGHNSGAVFGNLAGLSVGATFAVARNGNVEAYRIEKTVVLEEQTTHMASRTAGSYYFHGVFQGGRYDVLIQTCAGTNLGNGQATHRLFILANRI